MGKTLATLVFSLAVSSAHALDFSVDTAAGVYRLTHGSQVFEGTLPEGTPEILLRREGRDDVGEFVETSFRKTPTSSLEYLVRVYAGNTTEPYAVFLTRAEADVRNKVLFPNFKALPSTFKVLGATGNFGILKANAWSADGLTLALNAEGRGFAVSPLTNVLVSKLTVASGRWGFGIDPAVRTWPRGLTHKVLFSFGSSPRAILSKWADRYMSFGGVDRAQLYRERAADPLVAKVGYWTDRGANYYYKFEQDLGYEGTLAAMMDEMRAAGVEPGYLQLDSWWYPKGNLQHWSRWGILSGLYELKAHPTVLPSGLAALSRRVGAPLVVHSRWLDGSSPYRRQYRVSGNVVIDPEFWDSLMARLSSEGVAVFEQDWLSDKARTKAGDLEAPELFLGSMHAAAARENMWVQYCMPEPKHVLYGALKERVSTIRTSDDRFETARWRDFIFGASVATELGLRPWTDVFQSNEIDNLVISVLSGGVVGVGDSRGNVQASALRAAALSDGRIVRPTVGLRALDAAYVSEVFGSSAVTASAEYRFGGNVWGLDVVSLAPALALSELALGNGRWVAVERTHNGWGRPQPVHSNETVTFTSAAPLHRLLLVPAPTGLFVLGDENKIASLGAPRIQTLSTDGDATVVRVIVEGGETVRILAGRTDGGAPRASASAGRVVVSPGPTDGLWRIDVSEAAGAVDVELR